MHTPESTTDTSKIEKLEFEVERNLDRLNGHTGHAVAHCLLRTVVRQAARFFAYCPEDFGVNSFDDGHAVFGGTNRLYWSVFRGFWPDPPYCSQRFLAQFEEEWIDIGRLDTRTNPPRVDLSGVAGSVIAIPMGWGGNRHTIFGKRDKHQRITEVRFLTGMTEIPYDESLSSKQAQPQRPENSLSGV